MATKVYCDGGAGTDEQCQTALNDPTACCFSMTLKFIPADPTQAEAAVLATIYASGNPYQENSEGHVCLSGTGVKEIVDLSNEKDEWYMLGDDSVMFYKAYCDASSMLKAAVGTLLAGAIASSF